VYGFMAVLATMLQPYTSNRANIRVYVNTPRMVFVLNQPPSALTTVRAA
jgi:hypothetical protein